MKCLYIVSYLIIVLLLYADVRTNAALTRTSVAVANSYILTVIAIL